MSAAEHLAATRAEAESEGLREIAPAAVRVDELVHLCGKPEGRAAQDPPTVRPAAFMSATTEV